MGPRDARGTGSGANFASDGGSHFDRLNSGEKKRESDAPKTRQMSIRQPIRVDPRRISDEKNFEPRATLRTNRRASLEFSALVGDVIAGSGRSVERAAVFRATPAVCEPRHCRTAGGGGGICVTRSAITFGGECRRSRSCPVPTPLLLRFEYRTEGRSESISFSCPEL